MIFDDADSKSILEYSRLLEGKTVAEVKQEECNYEGDEVNGAQFEYGKVYRGKGGFGQFLEEQYFEKVNDNKSQPDFPKAKLELKVSPLKVLRNKEIRVKERLVLNHFTYKDIEKETFETSHFLMKDAKILLVFYFYGKNTLPENLKIYLVDIWECLKHDKTQILSDWETIVAKVRAGKAEEISEGDTLYLGACTKGASAESSMQEQPCSTIKAKGRALCFKQSYINHIFKLLSLQKEYRSVPSENHFLKEGDFSFERKVSALFSPYMNQTVTQISSELQIVSLAKSRLAILARTILGFSKKCKSFYEFDAGGIQIKTIRVGKNGLVKESMSFKPIQYLDIINQKWEDSDFYQELISKFIFIIFKRTSDDADYYLSGVKFWNMPEKDLEVVHGVWEDTKLGIIKDDFVNLPKIKEHRIAHVRPHAKNRKDVMPTPSGRFEYKRSFWLNNEYILKNIVKD
ncbi:MAG: Sau3AI family type II restriction endonuclease [Sphaerochaetaceae bacterium]